MEAEILRSRKQSGQAILEYMLILILILGIAGIMMAGVRSSRDKMWKRILCEVAPPCPTCLAKDSVKSAFPSSAVKCQ